MLAGIMTAFGAQTRAVPIGGMGQFDGVMLGAFKRPRIEGTFTGDRITAFDIDWGHIEAQAVIENAYVDVTNGIITKGESRTDVEGRFALGYPRRDGGEEINGRIRMTNRPLVDLKHAFDLDDYPMSGLLSGEFHLTGKYQAPFGFGKMTIDRRRRLRRTVRDRDLVAALRGQRRPARRDQRAEGQRRAARRGVHRLGRQLFVQRRWRADSGGVAEDWPRSRARRCSGVLKFSASGTGTFDEPRYDVQGRIDDFFVGDEGIGQVNGRLSAARRSADDRSSKSRHRGSRCPASGRIDMTRRRWTPS